VRSDREAGAVATGMGVGVARGAAAGAAGAGAGTGVAVGVASFAIVTFVVVQLAVAMSTRMTAPQALRPLFMMGNSSIYRAEVAIAERPIAYRITDQ
jgi:hypothetical protein